MKVDRGWLRRNKGQILKATVVVGLFVLIILVVFEDSDGTTFHDFTDYSTFHHEHIDLMLATLDVYVILYPTEKIAHWSIHASTLTLIVGGMLISAGFLNLPDNLRYTGGGGVSSTQAVLAGNVYNYSKPAMPVVGATANVSVGNVSLALVTNNQGAFSSVVPVGIYTVRLNATGYKTETVGNVAVKTSRGAHYVFLMVPTVSAAAPPMPVNNTNATNVPSAPSPPPPIPTLFYPNWCPMYVLYSASNGTRIISCVDAIRPYSQAVLFSGIALSLLGLVAVDYNTRKYGLVRRR